MYLHPIRTTQKIRATYEQYLKTIYPFQDETLRRLLWEKLSEPERLVKGPLLEASPPFARGRSIEELVAAGVLHPRFRQLCGRETTANPQPLPFSRPLYRHQEKAITNIVQRQRNLVVATGTGSGKTESFLIPILHHLLEEEERGSLRQPGVRALLLYPMNALANDQLKRLREVLEHYPGVTFGRYIGETPEETHKAEEAYLQEYGYEPLPNELVSRVQMRDTPPALLLTNYAMLEYLLIRPQDTSLFDGDSGRYWRFIVLDEAHVYNGASGIEVAMLLRRLKDRIVQSQRGKLRCMATSATLGEGRKDFGRVADFASELFGEPFSAEDVFEAERLPLRMAGEGWGVASPSLYAELTERESVTASEVRQVAGRHGVPAAVLRALEGRRDAADALYSLLSGDRRVHQLQGILADGPALLSQVAPQLFPEAATAAAAQDSAIQLVNLAVRARPDGDSLPLLPARYHLFARALEGAFACFNRQLHPDNQPRLYLGRHEQCPECHSRMFELATCARCGILYLVADDVRERVGDQYHHYLQLQKGMVGNENRALGYYVLADHLPAANEDEAEDATEEETAWLLQKVCLRCGRIVDSQEALSCHCQGPALLVHKAPFDGTDQEKMYCSYCATRSRGVVHRLLTGQDAPVSVLTTALYTELPPANEEAAAEQPGQGRKLLIFADSRQDAAFFAPYMDRTYQRIVQRRFLYQALAGQRDGELQLEDVAELLRKQAEKVQFFDWRESRPGKMRLVRKWLMRELTAVDRNQSLEGLGLLRIQLKWPPGWRSPAALLQSPWNLSKGEAETVIRLLLDSLRLKNIVTFPDGVDPYDEFFQPTNRATYISDQAVTDKRSPHSVLGWTPLKGSNNRLDLLEKVLAQTTPSLSEAERRAVALKTLVHLWDDHLVDPGNVWRRLAYFRDTRLGRSGIAYQLDHELWQWEIIEPDQADLYRCDHCKRLSFYSLRGICPTYGCRGQLEPVIPGDELEQHNHYRSLYRTLQPAALAIEEHTAQWRAEEARHIQNQFIRGDVNILSCSTTFELGVDVGSLQAVLMRNVPPTTANYVQRAGRAGRRQDAVAFVLTFAQRRSHDLAYYRYPEKIVSGKIPTPFVTIRNPQIVQRHMQSVLIADFLRWCVEHYQRFGVRHELKVGEFFKAVGELPSGAELFEEYVAGRPERIQQALLRIVPLELHQELGIESWSWLEKLTNGNLNGSFDIARGKEEEAIELYSALRDQAKEEERFSKAEFYKYILNTVRQRDLISFFSRHNILPKYGFPVDVVDFITDYVPDAAAGRVELQRDLRVAISEFAPGGQLVAAKKLWTGGGIYKPPAQTWEPAAFALCPQCSHFNKRRGTEPISQCGQCGHNLPINVPRKSGLMIVPEFGFLARRDETLPEPGEQRPAKIYASHIYFSNYAVPEYVGQKSEEHQHSLQAVPALTSPQVEIATRYSHYGELVVINHGKLGKGFRICTTCGFAESTTPSEDISSGVRRQPQPRTPQPRKPHSDPRTGRDCRGWSESYHLGHDFVTDVLEIQIQGSLVEALAAAASEEKSLWRSVLYATLEGASRALGIRRDDLDGTLYYTGQSFPSLILYDNVPGGAGHVKRIGQSLPNVFERAREHVHTCECGPETACHECLWSFYNQPYHHELARGLADTLLQGVLNQK